MADWIEICVATGNADADEVAARLAGEVAAAAAGTWVREGEVAFWVEAGAAEAALTATREAAARLVSAGFAIAPDAVTARAAPPESSWKEAYKHHFTTARLTRRLVVVPSWDRHQPEPEDLVIHLDPGQAFGTGAHASTQLVLAALEALADAGLSPAALLDVGTGSGILAIAAALLWPRLSCTAVDSDPVAVAVARDNCAQNGVGERVRCEARPVGDVAGRADVIVANIQADVLLALRDDIAARAAPGAHVLLSGLLSHQAREVAAAYAAAGLATQRVEDSDRDPEWAIAHLCRDGEESG